uniref:Uncharacterized protein n=1 Tax=Spongospora subterranea TaxID=70186 RepID=A0A0H5R8F6_9EUKA|eukprot:CRZ04624.1 hypothetical protein [Spongospora subterranea]
MTSTLPKSRRAKRAATLETWYRIYDKALIVTNHVSTTRRTGRSASIVERLSNPEALGHARLTYHFDGAKLKEGRASIAAKKIADLMDGPSSIYDSVLIEERGFVCCLSHSRTTLWSRLLFMPPY